jgi:hypothetical protein
VLVVRFWGGRPPPKSYGAASASDDRHSAGPSVKRVRPCAFAVKRPICTEPVEVDFVLSLAAPVRPPPCIWWVHSALRISGWLLRMSVAAAYRQVGPCGEPVFWQVLAAWDLSLA